MNRFQQPIWLFTIVLGLYTTASAYNGSWLEVVARDFAHTVTAPARLTKHPLQVGATAAIGALMVYRLDRMVDDNYAKSNNGACFTFPRL